MFGRLTIKSMPFKKTNNVSKSNCNRYHVKTECACGTSKDVPIAYLYYGGTKSCGCYRSELKQKGSFAKDGKKKCAHCRKVKKVECFATNNHCKDQLNPHCRECDHIKGIKKYALDEITYNNMLVQQDNRCAICDRKPYKRRLAVDHCHSTGKIRGLLCNECNTLLGRLGDDAYHVKQFIDKLLKYL